MAISLDAARILKTSAEVTTEPCRDNDGKIVGHMVFADGKMAGILAHSRSTGWTGRIKAWGILHEIGHIPAGNLATAGRLLVAFREAQPAVIPDRTAWSKVIGVAIHMGAMSREIADVSDALPFVHELHAEALEARELMLKAYQAVDALELKLREMKGR